MKKTPIFEGSCTAIVTPYQEGGIDYEKMGQLIDFQAENGTSALVVCGTTGENATQDVDEHAELLRFAHAHNKGRMKLIAGIGSNNTNTALHLGKEAEAVGYDGVLMVTPYYNKCTQNGAYAHYKAVSESVHIPIIAYNVPTRTGFNLAPETIARLSELPNVRGIKEASGDIDQVLDVARLTHGKLDFYSGDDSLTVPAMSIGAKGVISVAANNT